MQCRTSTLLVLRHICFQLKLEDTGEFHLICEFVLYYGLIHAISPTGDEFHYLGLACTSKQKQRRKRKAITFQCNPNDGSESGFQICWAKASFACCCVNTRTGTRGRLSCFAQPPSDMRKNVNQIHKRALAYTAKLFLPCFSSLTAKGQVANCQYFDRKKLQQYKLLAML